LIRGDKHGKCTSLRNGGHGMESNGEFILNFIRERISFSQEPKQTLINSLSCSFYFWYSDLPPPPQWVAHTTVCTSYVVLINKLSNGQRTASCLYTLTTVAQTVELQYRKKTSFTIQTNGRSNRLLLRESIGRFMIFI
jgi:hypothetical protein